MSNENAAVAVPVEPEMVMPATGAEAPASLNFRLVSPMGTWVQFTLRSNRMAEVYGNFLKFEKVLTGAGWTQPPSKEQSGAKGVAADTQMCPVHHEPMIKRTGKDKSTFYSHKTGDPRYEKGYCNGREPRGETAE